jgi:hypothetical protein
MKLMGIVAIGFALAGCKGKDKQPDKPVAVASGSTTGSAPPPPPPEKKCGFAGNYRLRFFANGTEGWWWRMKVTGDDAAPTAELVAPMEILGVTKTGPLDVKTDPATCTLTATAHSDDIGDMIAKVVLDPATSNVTGQYVRTKQRYDDEKVPAKIAGRRDLPGETQGGPGACIAPGVYELQLGDANWKSDWKKRGCEMVMLDHVTFRLEYLGDQIYAEAIGDDVWADTMVAKAMSGCALDVEYHDTDGSFTGKLTFAGKDFTGTLATAKYEIREDGDAGENQWACDASNVPVTGKRTGD